MFDPTSFDNLKVVLEGFVYEADLLGDIVIESRHDMVDLAAMSREYSLSFRTSSEASFTAKIMLNSSMRMLSSELISLPSRPIGAYVRICFYSSASLDVSVKTEDILHQFFGENRVFEVIDTHSSIHGKSVSWEYSFPEPMKEEQVDDLQELVTVCIGALEKLN
ncbi:hypothetical protein [Bacillus sp. 2205SS5-2]|uniref:hypothetical protein n=1 Tax=Bacillus sp. 2205SS5-2 TaxID=3109031 RepID=UPI003005C88F